MKNSVMVILLAILSSCNPTNLNKTSRIDSLENENKGKIANGVAHITYKELEGLSTSINIDPKSIDTIIATVTINNNTDSNLWLYKPILPIGELKGNYFNFMDTNFQHLDFIQLNVNKFEYLFGDPTHSPAIKVEDNIDSDKLILLKRKESINFSVNVAKYYNFKKSLLHNNVFTSHFFILMPFIQNRKQVWEIDNYDNILKPAYIVISSNASPNNLQTFEINY